MCRHLRRILFECVNAIFSPGYTREAFENIASHCLTILCEKNVQGQVEHVCQTDFVQKAWEQGSELSVHGWIYNIEDGRLKDLLMSRNAYLEKRLSV